MAIHFGESTDMRITIDSFKKAIEILEREERKMHYALGLDNSNPLATPARKILKFLEAMGKKTRKELMAEFWNSLPRGVQDLDDVLGYLEAMQKINSFDQEHSITKVKTVYYDIVRKYEATN